MKKIRIIKALLFLVCVGLFASCNQQPSRLTNADVKCIVYDTARYRADNSTSFNIDYSEADTDKVLHVGIVDWNLIQTGKTAKRYAILYNVALQKADKSGRFDYYVLADLTEWDSSKWDVDIISYDDELSTMMNTFAKYCHFE